MGPRKRREGNARDSHLHSAPARSSSLFAPNLLLALLPWRECSPRPTPSPASSVNRIPLRRSPRASRAMLPRPYLLSHSVCSLRVRSPTCSHRYSPLRDATQRIRFGDILTMLPRSTGATTLSAHVGNVRGASCFWRRVQQNDFPLFFRGFLEFPLSVEKLGESM